MKKIYSLLAIAAILTAGCKKASVTITEQQPPVTEEVETVEAVRFSLGQPSYEIATKSHGSLDAWNQNDVYILGYETVTTDFTLTNAFIPNVKATAGGGTLEAPLEVLNEDQPIYSDPDNPTLESIIGYEPYYYVGANVYDFYGYHVDDAHFNGTDTDAAPVPLVITETNTEQTDGTVLTPGVYVPIQIDGSQDIMSATTDKVKDGEAAGVPSNRSYSAYAARRGVHPTLNFKHELTRFTFNIKSGSEAGNDVMVKSLSVKSKSKGYLAVINGTSGITLAANETEAVSFYLKDRGPIMTEDIDPVPVDPLEYKCEDFTPVGFPEDEKYLYVLPNPDALPDPIEGNTSPDSLRIGESIMVFPGEATYDLTITTSMKDVQTEMPNQNFRLSAAKISGDENAKFEAGKSYNITIIIYGLEKVEITASLEEWEEGGDITLDPDNDFEAQYPEPVTDPDANGGTGGN